jgi:hypothetical protein
MLQHSEGRGGHHNYVPTDLGRVAGISSIFRRAVGSSRLLHCEYITLRSVPLHPFSYQQRLTLEGSAYMSLDQQSVSYATQHVTSPNVLVGATK